VITEKGAARAARQLLFHRQRIGWMLERISTNENALREYIAHGSRSGDAPPGSAPERMILPGGFAVAVDERGEVLVERLAGCGGFVQLTLQEIAPVGARQRFSPPIGKRVGSEGSNGTREE
jgi:hypothetical protein